MVMGLGVTLPKTAQLKTECDLKTMGHVLLMTDWAWLDGPHLCQLPYGPG